jgi:hypothetical protein
MAKKYFFEGLDFILAVQAYRVLMIETHCQADCLRLVYKPIQRLLERTALLKPKSLLLMRGRPYAYKDFAGWSADVYVITPFKIVAYLATIVSQEHAHFAFEWYKEVFQALLESLEDLDKKRGTKSAEESRTIAQDKFDLLNKRGEMAIIRERVGCKVPVDSNEPDNATIAKGVKRYFQAFTPQLAEVKIVWLPEKRQQHFNSLIKEKAGQIAMHQTDADRRKIVREDF